MEFSTMQFLTFTLIFLIMSGVFMALGFIAINKYKKMPEPLLAMLIAASAMLSTVGLYTLIF